jgi:hypothetical protein
MEDSQRQDHGRIKEKVTGENGEKTVANKGQKGPGGGSKDHPGT